MFTEMSAKLSENRKQVDFLHLRISIALNLLKLKEIEGDYAFFSRFQSTMVVHILKLLNPPVYAGGLFPAKAPSTRTAEYRGS